MLTPLSFFIIYHHHWTGVCFFVPFSASHCNIMISLWQKKSCQKGCQRFFLSGLTGGQNLKEFWTIILSCASTRDIWNFFTTIIPFLRGCSMFSVKNWLIWWLWQKWYIWEKFSESLAPICLDGNTPPGLALYAAEALVPIERGMPGREIGMGRSRRRWGRRGSSSEGMGRPGRGSSEVARAHLVGG